ncbi:MAG: hypothetical protein ACFFCS_18095 [Candidatus Hodarchaeota archaeon]
MDRLVTLLFRSFLLILLFLLGFAIVHDVIVNLPYTFGFTYPLITVEIKNPQWQPELAFPVSFIETVIFIVTLVTCWAIFLFIQGKYKDQKKLSTGLLAHAFLFVMISIAGLFLYNILEIKVASGDWHPSLIRKFLLRLPFLALASGILFLVFFIMELFMGGLDARKNAGRRKFFVIISLAVFAFLIVEFLDQVGYEIPQDTVKALVIVATAASGIEILVASIIQLRSGFSLRAKARESSTRQALLFIGMAGIFMLVMFGLEITEEVLRNVELPPGYISGPDAVRITSNACILVYMLLTYRGWIHPGLQKKTTHHQP